MSLLADLRTAWALAEQRTAGSALRVVGIDGIPQFIHAAISPDGRRGLLISVSAQERIRPFVAAVNSSTETLRAESYPFQEGGQARRAILLTCTRSDVDLAFSGFCESFIVRCVTGTERERAFVECVAEFKRLLAAQVLTPIAKLTGFLGELLFLDELTSLDASAYGYWSFPDKERHDFRNTASAVECKTSLRAHDSKPLVTISSIDQLDTPANGSLHLAWFHLERTAGGAISVDSLCARVRERLPAAAAASFRDRVEEYVGDEESSRMTFSLLDRRTYAVTSAFPRLSASRLCLGRLDAGISQLSYTLDLSAAEAFRCDDSDAARTLTRMDASA